MIATFLPSPTLLNVFEDVRRCTLDAIEFGRDKLKLAVAANERQRARGRQPRAIKPFSLSSLVPLVIRYALERRGAAHVAQSAVELPSHAPAREAVAPRDAELPLISHDFVWMRATAPIVAAQTGARDVFKLHEDAGEHIDAATYALEGLLLDLKAVMPGIQVRSAKLHSVDFRAGRRDSAVERLPQRRTAHGLVRAA